MKTPLRAPGWAMLLSAALAGCSSDPPENPAASRGADAAGDFRDGRLADAARGYEAALGEARFAVDVPAAVRHLNNLGVVALYEGKLDVAERRFMEALDLCMIDGTEADRARLRLQLACARLRRADAGGNAEEAERDLGLASGDLEAAAGWAEQEGGSDRAQYEAIRAGLQLRRGDAAGAADWARRAREDAESPEETAGACVLLGRALAADRAKARAAWEDGLAAAREAGHLPLAVECLLGLAESWAAEDAPRAKQWARLAWEAAKARGWNDGCRRAEDVLLKLEKE